jgi:hypothetical protein
MRFGLLKRNMPDTGPAFRPEELRQMALNLFEGPHRPESASAVYNRSKKRPHSDERA